MSTKLTNIFVKLIFMFSLLIKLNANGFGGPT